MRHEQAPPSTASEDDAVSVLACSMSESSASSHGELGSNSSTPRSQQARGLGPGAHSSSASKKVDFVLMLHTSQTSDIGNAIHSRTLELGGTPRPFFNQISYTAIPRYLISVAIETKTAICSRDPVVQLGIWTATWHRRMDMFRTAFDMTNMGTVVSLPLVTIVGHE